MVDLGTFGIALAAVCALVPGAYSWIAGRRLMGLADDPALPERLMAHRSAVAAAVAVPTALTLVLATAQAAWSLPVSGLLLLAGGFPLRRYLHGETWSFPTYVVWMLRLSLAFLGFWLLLLAAPGLIVTAGTVNAPLAAALTATLLLWNHFHARVLLALSGAEPLGDESQVALLERVRERSEVEKLSLWRLPARGGSWMNAFALPMTAGPGVAFTNTLLERLEPAELGAIHAHELAHLEHFSGARLSRIYALGVAAVLLGTIGVPLLMTRIGPGSWGIAVVWMIAVFVALVLKARGNKEHEAESDRRAVEISGDPEALIRALEKLTASARLPRRWSAEQRSTATHPDLAERIRSIRGVAATGVEDRGCGDGAFVEGPSPPLVLRSTQAGRWLSFEAGRVTLFEGGPAGEGDAAPTAAELRASASKVEVLEHERLVEVSLLASGRGEPKLRIRDREGGLREIAIAAEKVPALQSALDALPRFADAPPLLWRERALPVVAVALLVVVGTMSVGGFQPSIFVALLAIFRPGGASLFALAFAAAGDALMGGLSGAALVDLRLLVAGAVAGIFLGVISVRREPRADRMHQARPIWLVAATGWAVMVAVLGWMLAQVENPAELLHHAVRSGRSLVVWPLAILGAAIAVRGPWVLAMGVAAGLLAGAFAGVATDSQRARWAPDEWAALGAPVVARRRVELRHLEDFEVAPGRSLGRLRIAPEGDWVAFEEIEEGAEPFWSDDQALASERRFVVAGAGARHEVEALDLALLGDDRALVLRRRRGGLEVSLEAIGDDSAVHWSRDLPTRERARLQVDRSGAWQVAGGFYEASGAKVSWGDGSGAGETSTWPMPPALDPDGQFDITPTKSGTLVVATRYEPVFGSSLPMLLFTEMFTAGRSEIWAMAPAGAKALGETRNALDCVAPALTAAEFLCRADEPGESFLWRVDAASGERLSLGRMGEGVWGLRRTGDGRAWAWLASGPAILEFEPKSGAAAVVELGLDCDCAGASIAVADRHVAVAERGETPRVRRYALP